MTAPDSALAFEGPNAQEIENWNVKAGDKWARNRTSLERFMTPITARIMEKAALRAGEAVLDIGCGCGATSLAAAGRVGPSGTVVGVDVSAPMLAEARAFNHAPNVEYVLADAALHAFPPARFDLVFSRFGVMFFSDPVAAFKNIRTALQGGARLAFVCWQPLKDNPWVTVPLTAALKHIPKPPPADPFAPGPFAFADPARVESILTGAGFSAVSIEPATFSLHVGQPGPDCVDEAMHFATELGPASRLIADAEEPAREAAQGEIRKALAALQTPQGISLGAACWLVGARA